MNFLSAEDTIPVAMNEEQRAYLGNYLRSIPIADREKYVSFSAGYFCADEKSANICSELVRMGKKTATCSMKYWYESGQVPMPKVGHLHVVTDWEGAPSSIIQVTEVEEASFSAVSAGFAHAEGEGDRTLEWWRKAHWAYFSGECAGIGIEPSENMVLILERFRLVYP